MAAVALLPLPFVMIPTARNAPRLAERVGFRRVTPLGLVLTAAGLFVLAQVGVDLDDRVFAAGLVVFALGMGLAGTPSTTAITSSLPHSKQGVASAVNDTARELGSALGIAILGSALNQAYRDGMASAVVGLPEQARERPSARSPSPSRPRSARPAGPPSRSSTRRTPPSSTGCGSPSSRRRPSPSSPPSSSRPSPRRVSGAPPGRTLVRVRPLPSRSVRSASEGGPAQASSPSISRSRGRESPTTLLGSPSIPADVGGAHAVQGEGSGHP